MIRWIVESSMKLRFLVIVLALLLLIFGFAQLRQMPVAVYPEIDPPHVEVQTEALGLSAEEIEAMLTVPMEADLLNGVAWLDQIYSKSVAGLSSILLVFEPGTDPIRARQMVQERLTEAYALPNVSKPPLMLQPVSSANRVLMAGLSSDELSPIEMGVLARWIIQPRLLGVPGVANVAVWGQRERQLQVLVDPEELHQEGVTLSQVVETAGEALWYSPLSYLEASAPGTAGWIDTPNQRLSVRHLQPITTADDLAKVAVVNNKNLTLGDVATVVEDHQPLIGDAALNDGPGFLLVVEKFPGANTLDVTQGVEKALADLQPGLQGMEIDTSVFRPADYIDSAVGNLGLLALIGGVLVILVLLAFYFQWRTALISLLAIPLSLVAAGMILYVTDATFNIMVLAGMAAVLAIVVDDAVVDPENIAERLRQRRREEEDVSASKVILGAVLETRSPLGYALVIILLLLLPLFFLPGLTGSLIRPLVVSYTLAMIASLLVALIVTPALSLSLLSNASLKRESPITKGLRGFYSGLLARTVRSSTVTIIVAAVLIVIGVVSLLLLDVSLLPTLKQRDLLIQFEAAPGTSRPEMNRIVAQASGELQAIPGVQNIGSHVGRAITGDSVVYINSADLWVSIAPKADHAATVAAIQEVVDGYPGLERQVQTYQPESLGPALTGPDNDVVVRLYGHELEVLRDMAGDVELAMAAVPGVVGAQASIYSEEPQVEIEVDLAAAEQRGIKPGDIRRQATTLLSGIHVGNLYEEQKVFDVLVWGQPELRSSMTNIDQLLIDTPDGSQVPLGELADVRIAPAATVIERDAVSRFVDVGADVSGRSIDAVKADIESSIQQMPVPFEYHMEVLSDAQGLQANQQRLIAIAVAALIGIFLVIQAGIGGWRLALAIFLTSPVALVGGLLAAVIAGGVLSIGSLFGLLTVLAIAVRSGLVMVNHIQRLAHEEGDSVEPELVVRGAADRVAPILMTALATVVALLPMLIGGGIAGNEMLSPLAAVMVGGLITSTLLNLFIVPALYLRWPSTLPAVDTSLTEATPTAEAV
ncbi:MAG: efflux RND transporter permease subunit [Chloroflexota bacterium]|nr:MAG: efflux RND transporter permease subunit [Chloroflexota bacterium]